MIFIGRILTEETKKKRRIAFYNKAIDKAKSEIGKKYNRLTITDIDYEKSYDSYFNKKYHRIYVRTKCDCGETSPPNQLAAIQCGHIKSCGCYASEQIAKRNKEYSTKTNKFIDNGDNTYYLLDDNNNKCLIDKDDYDIVKRWYWRKIDKRGNIDKGYWVTNVKIDDKYNKSVLMIHQVIAEIKYGEYESSNSIPDHLSRDTDDNRKCNIILKSNQRNSHNRGLSKVNTSGKTGVSYNKEKNMWTAYITVNYKTKYLGDYTDFNDAVNARKEAEKKYGFTCDDIVADYDKEVI